MRSLGATCKQIKADWPDIVRHSRVRREAHDCLPQGIKLFGSSTKTQLSAKVGVLTSVLYMSPARESGVEMCSRYATKTCKRLCLGHNSGRLAMAPHKRARLWKTALYHGDRGLFYLLAAHEAAALCNKAAKLDLEPAMRFDGSTDTGIGGEFAMYFGDVHPELHVYDYTKDPFRARMSLQHNAYATYDVTLSYTGENWPQCSGYLAMGGRVAVVFDVQKSAQLPRSYWGFPIVDGDQHDATWTHAPGVIIGLRLKAATSKQLMRKLGLAGGFVVSPAGLPS